jgi:hypothetical protein
LAIAFIDRKQATAPGKSASNPAACSRISGVTERQERVHEVQGKKQSNVYFSSSEAKGN